MPLAPLLMVAPPAKLTVRLPLSTLILLVARLPSTSLTLMPVIDSAVSSFTLWALGTVLTGASLVTPTLMVAVSVPPPLVTV